MVPHAIRFAAGLILAASSLAGQTRFEDASFRESPGTWGPAPTGGDGSFLPTLAFQAHADGGSESLAGATVYYKLQLSPPPGAATFNDVPARHPFLQFVEALGASGITGGCGGGNYCPDARLTRGQMAVFLAKALGLQWP